MRLLKKEILNYDTPEDPKNWRSQLGSIYSLSGEFQNEDLVIK